MRVCLISLTSSLYTRMDALNDENAAAVAAAGMREEREGRINQARVALHRTEPDQVDGHFDMSCKCRRKWNGMGCYICSFVHGTDE